MMPDKAPNDQAEVHSNAKLYCSRIYKWENTYKPLVKIDSSRQEKVRLICWTGHEETPFSPIKYFLTHRRRGSAQMLTLILIASTRSEGLEKIA